MQDSQLSLGGVKEQGNEATIRLCILSLAVQSIIHEGIYKSAIVFNITGFVKVFGSKLIAPGRRSAPGRNLTYVRFAMTLRPEYRTQQPQFHIPPRICL